MLILQDIEINLIWVTLTYHALNLENDVRPNSEGMESKSGNLLLDMTEKYFLSNIVKHPTRGPNILDSIFTSNDDLVYDIELLENCEISDHYLSRIICLPLPEQACIQLVKGPLPCRNCGKAFSSPLC